MRRPLALVLLLAAAAGRAAPPPPDSVGHGPGGPPRGGPHGLFLSPMGEPFRGSPEGASGVRAWFDGADADRDGRITLAEFAADADRFFRTLDTDRDGEIDPAEIDHYEKDVAPEIAAHGMAGGRGGGGGFGRGGRRGGPGGMGSGGMGGGGMGGGPGGRRGPPDGADGGGGAPEGRQGAGRFSFLNIPEPVASADRDFNRGVSRSEFAKTAGQRFLLLDTAHRGYLTFDTLPPLPQRGWRERGRRRPPPPASGDAGVG